MGSNLEDDPLSVPLCVFMVPGARPCSIPARLRVTVAASLHLTTAERWVRLSETFCHLHASGAVRWIWRLRSCFSRLCSGWFPGVFCLGSEHFHTAWCLPYTHIHIYIYIYMHIYVVLYMRGHMYVYVYMYVYIYTYICTHTYRYRHRCRCRHIHVCICLNN